MGEVRGGKRRNDAKVGEGEGRLETTLFSKLQLLKIKSSWVGSVLLYNVVYNNIIMGVHVCVWKWCLT